jgi:PKD repeat protein/regulation of enolase protein 1 (concanavalin A-like superfamily)
MKNLIFIVVSVGIIVVISFGKNLIISDLDYIPSLPIKSSMLMTSGTSNVACAAWQDMALGSGTGSAAYSECGPDTVAISTNAVTGPGATSDNQHIVYHELCGNGEIIAKVAGITNSGYAGLFARESSAAGARKGAIMTQKGSQVFRQIRLTTNGITAQASYMASGHQWLKLTRSGTQVMGSWSTNGSTWNMAFLTSLSMTDCVVMGMFAYSGNSNTTITATFTDLSIVQSDSIPATEVAFADSSLTAQSGDTVEICVELENPCYCSPLSVDVALASDSLPHLVGFEPQTLTFEPGDTVQCFSVVMGAADTSGTYTFELTNISGGYESEVGEFEALTLVVEAGEEQGAVGYCGSFTKDSVTMEPGVSYFFDRFGNVYDLEELLLPESSSRTMTTECGCEEFTEQDIPGISSSYFNLVFEDCEVPLNGGFNDATLGSERRKVACKVFAALSQLISARSNPCEEEESSKVNVRFVRSDDPVIINYQNGATLASASPFYDNIVVQEGGILDGLPWRVINNGRYTHFENTAMFHGEVRVDFTKPFYLEDDPSVPALEYDLYSVLLHEALHLLGFASLIDPISGVPLLPGGSKSYSRYDTFLELETSTKVVARDNTDPYQWNLNILTDSLHISCQDTINGDMVFPPLTGSDLPIYTGNINDGYNFLRGRAFSHLNADCNMSGVSYLMMPGFDMGIRRDIGEPEQKILCAIGYQVAGIEDCACVASGDHDSQAGCDGAAFELEICGADTSILIDLSSLLDNDQPNQSIGYLTLVTPDAGTIDTVGGMLRFTPCAPGTHLLKYIPMKEDCQEGSTVLIKINVTRCLEDCSFFSTEEPVNAGYNNNPCNLICNPEVFIEGEVPDGYVESIEFNLHGYCYDLPGWYAATGTPDYVEQTQVQGPFSQIDVAATVFPNSGSIQMQTRSSAESTFTPLSVGQGGYFFSYYAAGRLHELSASSESNLTMHPRLVDQAIMDQFIRTNAVPGGVSEIDLNAGESLALMNSQFAINKTSLTFHRSLSCFEVEPGESYDGLWFYPGTLSSMNRGFSFIDQVELLPDDFTAGEDLQVYDCDTTALGGVDFCMLSDVPVLYTWKDEQDNVLLSYEVEREYDGTFKVDGQANSSIPYLVVSPDETITYTLMREVVGNDFPDFADCFTAEDDIVVEVMESPAPDAGFSALTFCLFASFTSNPTEGEHDWDFGGAGALTGTDEMPVFEYEQAGVYQVIHTVTNVCGQIDADTIAITVEDCTFSDLICECTDPYVLDVESFNPPQTEVKLSYFTDVINYLPDDYLTNACIIIRGRLVVDVDYEINESEVLMEEGAEIVVAPQAKFALSGMNATQKVHGCEYMWKGITVQTDGHFIAKQAWIEDAHYAVRPLDKSRVDISSSTFIDNYVGLYFEGPYVFEMDPFYGNTFATDDDLLPAYAGQTPAPGLRSFAGIEVVDRYNLLHIGVAGAPENVFENLRNGIVTKNTPLFVERSRFLGIEITSSEPTYPFTGIGIRHEGGAAHQLTVLGFGASGQTAFEDCTDAVWAQGTDTKVTQARLTDVARGIQVRLAQQRHIEIYHNYIACTSRGILLLHNDPAALISLHHNTIHAGSASPLSKAIGIMVSEQGLAQNQAYIGPRNIVQTYGYDMGIYLGSANGYVISDNEITLNHSTSSLYGIAARDALNSTIELNYVEGAATDSGTGIDVLSSTGMAYSCNTLHNLQTGMHLNGTCTDTDIRGNTFEPPFVDGLHYGSLLDINAQLHRGNQWLSGTYSGAAARNDMEDNPDALDNLDIQRYEVHDDQSAYYPPGFAFPNLPGPTGFYIVSWFPVDPTGNPWDCEDQLTGDEREKIREIDIPVALGTAPAGDYEEARRWGARQQLYRKVALQGGETDTLVVDSFYVSQSDSLLGLLYEIEAGKKHLFEQSTTEQQEVVALSHDRDSLVQRLAALDSILIVAEEDVWALRDTLLEKAGFLFQDMDSLDQLIKAEIYYAAEYLGDDNDALESAKGYAQNELDVNSIYLSTLASGVDTFSAVQLSALGGIAEQCSYSGGRPVYKARHLLHLPYPDSLRVDPGCYQALAEAEANNIVPAQKTRKTEEKSTTSIDWRVYPNPARNALQIDIANSTPVTIALLDMYGRVLLSQQAEEAPLGQNLIFDISILNNGLYLLELSGMSINRQLTRVVIMK